MKHSKLQLFYPFQIAQFTFKVKKNIPSVCENKMPFQILGCVQATVAPLIYPAALKTPLKKLPFLKFLLYDSETKTKNRIAFIKHWNDARDFWHLNQPLSSFSVVSTRTANWRSGWHIKKFWKTVSFTRKINKNYRRVAMDQIDIVSSRREMVYIFSFKTLWNMQDFWHISMMLWATD